jgi:ATP-binding cassette, subfamily C (CFTR/MRP), member 1
MQLECRIYAVRLTTAFSANLYLSLVVAYGLITISGPFQITVAFISLYQLLGWPAFVGVAIMIVSVPLNTLIASYMKKLQVTQMKNRDARTRMMSELLSNIKSVKLYAWEETWLARVAAIRNDKEVKMLRKIGIVTAFNWSLWSGIPCGFHGSF